VPIAEPFLIVEDHHMEALVSRALLVYLQAPEDLGGLRCLSFRVFENRLRVPNKTAR
jgi:hypothetical protein